jgi:hypothetical protein
MLMSSLQAGYETEVSISEEQAAPVSVHPRPSPEVLNGFRLHLVRASRTLLLYQPARFHACGVTDSHHASATNER